MKGALEKHKEEISAAASMLTVLSLHGEGDAVANLPCRRGAGDGFGNVVLLSSRVD